MNPVVIKESDFVSRIPDVAFDGDKGFVAAAEEIPFVLVGFQQCGGSDADADVDHARFRGGVVPLQGLVQFVLQAGGQPIDTVWIGGGENGDEFISAVAGDVVGRAQSIVHQTGDPTQHLIAGDVPPAIVDLLEVIDVDDDQGKWLLITRGGCECAAELKFKTAAVTDTGQGIFHHRTLQAFPFDEEGIYLPLQFLEIISGFGRGAILTDTQEDLIHPLVLPGLLLVHRIRSILVRDSLCRFLTSYA